MGKLPLRGSRQKPNNKSNSSSSYKSKLGVVGGAVHKNNNNSNNNNNNNGINKKKSKAASLKNQIRSTQRLLKRGLPTELREAQEKKLEELKKQQLEQNRLAEERKIFLRDRKIKFFERRKIERRLRRTEKQQRVSLNEEEENKIMEELVQLKKDLEYVRFFPKAEKYVPLFCGDDDNQELVDNRNRLRLQIKANIIAAAASGKDLEETGSEDDGPTDLTDDDFFVSGSSSDEADADDELTDLSAREHSSAAPTTATGMYEIPKDKMIQKQSSARSLMPPPRPQKSSTQRFDSSNSRNTSKNRKISHSSTSGFQHSQAGPSSSRNSNPEFPKRSNNGGFQRAQVGQNSNRNTKEGGFRHGQAGHGGNRGFNSDAYKQTNGQGFQNRQVSQNSNRSSNSNTFRHSNDEGVPNAQASQSSNISSNSDAPKKPRKRRPKKKKQ